MLAATLGAIAPERGTLAVRVASLCGMATSPLPFHPQGGA
jgi:hypothetical protein